MEVQRGREKGKIKERCEAYLAYENKYTVLPKEYQSFTNRIPVDKLNEYKKEASNELKKLVIDDENIFNSQKDIIESKLDEQVVGRTIYTLKNSKLIKISKYEFDGDQVTVTLEDSMNMEFIEKNSEQENEEIQAKSKTNKIEDEITLKKVNNEWKIIYANVGINQDILSNMFM